MDKIMHHAVNPVEADARVTVFQCGAETWVHVSSSSVVDWPTVEALLADDVRAGLIGERVYRPGRPTPQERAEGQWLCDDWVYVPAMECR